MPSSSTTSPSTNTHTPTTTTTAFEYPPFYNLTPFFTLQPVLTTREKQTRLWIDLIVRYCEHYGIYTLNVDEALNSPLFRNASIQRKLSKESALYFLDQMAKEGKAEYHDAKQKTHVDIYWKSPSQWADIIYQWVNTNGYNGSVLTIYELLEGDTGEGAEFHGMNPELFRKAILALNQKGYAELMQGSTAEADGVKFK